MPTCDNCGKEGKEENMILCTDCGSYFCDEDCAERSPCPDHPEGIHTDRWL